MSDMTINGGQLTNEAQSVEDVVQQVQLIQSLMRKVMKSDTHYGVIPGCGDKPALLKPGAEKICLIFRLSAQFHIDKYEQTDEHREYSVTCRLVGRDGIIYGEGIGVASTMENKYRYRWENTGEAVPSAYWDVRDVELLGGQSYAPRKVNNQWMIFHRVEHDNPSDYYNTVAKMAKKRAHVDATLTTTAASDIFEQDIEDPDAIPPNHPNEYQQDSKPARQQPQQNSNLKVATEKQCGLMRARLKDSGKSESDLCGNFDVTELESLPIGSVNNALDWIAQ